MIHGWSWLYGLHLLFCFFVPGSYVSQCQIWYTVCRLLAYFNFFVNAFLDLLLDFLGWRGRNLYWPSNMVLLKVTQLLLMLSQDKTSSQSTSARKSFTHVAVTSVFE